MFSPLDTLASREWALTPFRMALLYLFFGFGALALSDMALPLLLDGAALRVVQSTKGAAEVLLTAVFIYLLVRVNWQERRLKERAMDEAPVGITLSDPDREDNPLISANRRFETLTGYGESEAVGRNCRFLQGEETAPETRARIREAIDDERPVSVDIRNYRKNGEVFWNKVDIAPVRDDEGRVTNYVGFQTDITDRKIREERLAVLNRILRHNVRNRLTVISGYLEVLRDEIDCENDEAREALEKTDDAVEEFLSLVERVRDTERVVRSSESTDGTVALGERLQEVVTAYRDQFPRATLTLSLPDSGDCSVPAVGLPEAMEEAVKNAVKHNDDPEPTVAVRVTRPRDGWLEVEVEDDGPGIPDEELAVLEEGETQLTHGTRMGLWMIHWVVNEAGGTLTVSSNEEGTTLTVAVPTA